MRGIVFDIDDTLYCRQDMLVRAAETVLGVKVPDWPQFISIFYEKSDINMAQLESGEVLQSHMVISDALASVLDKLASDPEIKLAILTAGESKHQWNKVDMLDLDRWFDRSLILVTGDTPYTKPDIELFRMMEDRLGLSPSDLWMVGDNYDKDIAGAIKAGWHSLWINRRRLPAPKVIPDISVLDDAEFVEALAKEFL